MLADAHISSLDYLWINSNIFRKSSNRLFNLSFSLRIVFTFPFSDISSLITYGGSKNNNYRLMILLPGLVMATCNKQCT